MADRPMTLFAGDCHTNAGADWCDAARQHVDKVYPQIF